MLEIDLSQESAKYLKHIHPKHRRQIAEKIFKLAENPHPHDAKSLRGYETYFRADIGEHRIIYRISKTILRVTLVGKRNDGEVFKKFKRLST